MKRVGCWNADKGCRCERNLSQKYSFLYNLVSCWDINICKFSKEINRRHYFQSGQATLHKFPFYCCLQDDSWLGKYTLARDHSSYPTEHMALLKKINQILLLLLILTVCAILYNKVHKVPSALKNEAVDLESPQEMEEEIPVVICAAAGRMGATVAAISSIYSNTEANVLFYIVGLKNTIPHIRRWIENSKLNEIKFKTVEFNPMVLKGKIRQDASRPELLQPLNFVRFYLPLLIQKHEKVIYLDDDVIVQGDIQELYDTKLAPGHAAAFSDDCDLPSTHEIVRSVGMQNTYMGFLDYRKQAIRDLGISPSTCSFNPGVIVANMTEWKKQRLTKQLEKWMQRNVEENLYSSTLGGGVATSPMLIVFHGKHSTINPMWHIRHLGWSPDTRYSEHFLQEAKLLHWNGRYKPWDYPSVHTDLWENWFIPDPSGKFKLTRPDS